jgi:hypothetical protein
MLYLPPTCVLLSLSLGRGHPRAVSHQGKRCPEDGMGIVSAGDGEQIKIGIKIMIKIKIKDSDSPPGPRDDGLHG